MKKLIVALVLMSSAIVHADQTNNIVNPSNWTGQSMSGNISNNPRNILGCCTGSGAFVDTGQNAIYFSYNQTTVNQVTAINQALQNTGVQINGYTYSWQYWNNGYNSGTLNANVRLAGANGTVLQSDNYSLGATEAEWTTYSGTRTYTTPYSLSQAQYIGIAFTGRDNRFWAGYYGPAVRYVDLRLNYSTDLCASNPLSSTSCAGYQQAYLDQQCASNPLYSTSCAGYQAAYQTQQCTANPLYATTCAGYQQAYYNQQCSLNGLYDRLCPNYSTAYATKMLLDKPATTTTTTTTTTTATTDTTNVAISDPVVNNAVSTTSTTNATSPTSVTSVVVPTTTAVSPTSATAQAAITASVPVQPTAAQQQERQADAKQTDTQVKSVERKSGGNQQAAKEAATAQAKELAKKSGEAATMEAQIATQGLQVGLMGYVPGFSAYQNALVPDVLGAAVARQYHNPTVDNRSAQRQLSGSNEVRWREMVDSQYK